MKLHADRPDTFSITGYGEGWVAVNGQRHEGGLVLCSGEAPADWNCRRFEDLTAAHFERLLACSGALPELVVFGSGPRLRFVKPVLLQALIARHIGVETMDTAAACRTYNILAGEGRRVVAALLVHS